MREMAKSIIGEDNYFEIYVKADLETCRKRDPKGLYLKEIPKFTGISSPYEEPLHPHLTVNTEENTQEQCVDTVAAFVIEHIQI